MIRIHPAGDQGEAVAILRVPGQAQHAFGIEAIETEIGAAGEFEGGECGADMRAVGAFQARRQQADRSARGAASRADRIDHHDIAATTPQGERQAGAGNARPDNRDPSSTGLGALDG